MPFSPSKIREVLRKHFSETERVQRREKEQMQVLHHMKKEYDHRESRKTVSPINK